MSVPSTWPTFPFPPVVLVSGKVQVGRWGRPSWAVLARFSVCVGPPPRPQVLGRPEFKALLRWRTALAKALAPDLSAAGMEGEVRRAYSWGDVHGSGWAETVCTVKVLGRGEGRQVAAVGDCCTAACWCIASCCHRPCFCCWTHACV
jgi:hypothetical protein